MPCKQCGRYGQAMMMQECINIQECELERHYRDLGAELERERERFDYGNPPPGMTKWAYESMIDAYDDDYERGE